VDDLWRHADAGDDAIAQLVYLSNLIGRDSRLVQRGGGNTSVKLPEPDLFDQQAEALVVKGSGTDLRTIDAGGFTHLYLDRLAGLRTRGAIDDAEMLELMRAAMLYPGRDPLPSVETPLHSLLPFRFIAHTHDVATLSLSDTPSAEDNVMRAFGDEVAFLPYARPGFPLAKLVAERYAERPPDGAVALVLEKHGLVVWGDEAKGCYENLVRVISKAEEFVAERAGERAIFGDLKTEPLQDSEPRALAAKALPALRGALAQEGWRPVLTWDGGDETLDDIGRERFAEVAVCGVMTPEHILRAGVLPLVLHPGLTVQPDAVPDILRESVRQARAVYVKRVARRGHRTPIADDIKTVLVPGLGAFYAGADRRAALTAQECYRATLEVMRSAEAVESFAFLSEADATDMEYWPLERRKVEEVRASRPPLDGKVALVVGGASGIGKAASERLAGDGAHIAIADLDSDGAAAVVREINATRPDRAVSLRVDVTDPASVAEMVGETVLHFGGLDVLFYSPGVAPDYAPVVDMPDDEVEEKLRVHYQGAVSATREAARVMVEQRLGGRLIYNASKAAFAPGEGFAAYGASKAALVHYVRNAASELGKHGITANYINADAVETPLFRALVRIRAEQSGRSEDEVLESYAQRSILRHAMVPPDAVADAVAWLASERAAYTTGCVITVGGGHEAFPR